MGLGTGAKGLSKAGHPWAKVGPPVSRQPSSTEGGRRAGCRWGRASSQGRTAAKVPARDSGQTMRAVGRNRGHTAVAGGSSEPHVQMHRL